MARDIPLVVLINPGSASAAEILAGALQENERAKLIGEATTGTGTVLRPFSLSDGSLLRLGVTNWLTPGYSLIKGHGIQPDVKVEQEATVEMISSVLLEELTKARCASTKIGSSWPRCACSTCWSSRATRRRQPRRACPKERVRYGR